VIFQTNSPISRENSLIFWKKSGSFFVKSVIFFKCRGKTFFALNKSKHSSQKHKIYYKKLTNHSSQTTTTLQFLKPKPPTTLRTINPKTYQMLQKCIYSGFLVKIKNLVSWEVYEVFGVLLFWFILYHILGLSFLRGRLQVYLLFLLLPLRMVFL